MGVVDSGHKGRGAWRVYAGKLPLEPLLINLQLCPHEAFFRVRIKKGDREQGKRKPFLFFLHPGAS